MSIITTLYNNRYRYQYTFEYYAHLLERGYDILQSGRLNASNNTVELRALQIALEYNMYAMSED